MQYSARWLSAKRVVHAIGGYVPMGPEFADAVDQHVQSRVPVEHCARGGAPRSAMTAAAHAFQAVSVHRDYYLTWRLLAKTESVHVPGNRMVASSIW